MRRKLGLERLDQKACSRVCQPLFLRDHRWRVQPDELGCLLPAKRLATLTVPIVGTNLPPVVRAILHEVVEVPL